MALIVVVQIILGVIYGVAAFIAAYFAGEAGGDVAGWVAAGAVVVLAPLGSAAAFGRRVRWVWALGVTVTVATMLYAAFGYDT